jgi:mono/diheme cytochrome c family protein
MDLIAARVVGAALAACLLMAGEALADQTAPQDPGAEHRRGRELYNASCVVCHGPGAKGGIGPRLAGNPVLSNDTAFHKILSEGRHMMPPLKDTVTEEQLGAIRGWLRSLP